MKGEDLLKTKYYIIGDPVKREKINRVLSVIWATVRVIGMSIVLGFACIGFGVVMRQVLTILSW